MSISSWLKQLEVYLVIPSYIEHSYPDRGASCQTQTFDLLGDEITNLNR